ncbi:hypothetical protein IW261DRAFT_1608762 [Armillaria novae-zelandiae]|uniref:Uncharacterized protein n=1 Tax=Armillaria novae-zelandiae TaxID=153914 RepID=A0AA39P561_9AGAR|nr:hypothetical protein IW261DRAFT_1608762 [Armillaria novae-zelandiae]
MLSIFTITLSLVAAVLGAPNIALRDVETFARKSSFPSMVSFLSPQPNMPSHSDFDFPKELLSVARIPRKDSATLSFIYWIIGFPSAPSPTAITTTASGSARRRCLRRCILVSTPRALPLAVARPGERPSVAMPTLTEMAMQPMSPQYGVAKSVPSSLSRYSTTLVRAIFPISSSALNELLTPLKPPINHPLFLFHLGAPASTTLDNGIIVGTFHVSGLVAYLIGLNGNQSPAAISSLIKSLRISGVLSNIPSGTVNLSANNGY